MSATTLLRCPREKVLEPATRRELKPKRQVYHWGYLLQVDGDGTAIRTGDKEIPLRNGHIHLDYKKRGPQEVIVKKRKGTVVLEFPMIVGTVD